MLKLPLVILFEEDGAYGVYARTPTELEHPSPDRLVGDVQAALGQEFLDVSVAEREAQIEILPKRERLGDHPGRQS